MDFMFRYVHTEALLEASQQIRSQTVRNKTSQNTGAILTHVFMYAWYVVVFFQANACLIRTLRDPTPDPNPKGNAL